MDRVRTGIGTWFDTTLFRLALLDKDSVFFLVGWECPILMWLLILLGLRKHALIMWDDGPSPASLLAFLSNPRSPRQALKRFLIRMINRTEGAYFCTGHKVIDDVETMGVRGDKLISLPFFVRDGSVDPALRERHIGGRAGALIVAGGRLTASKGFDVFIAALVRLRQAHPDGWKAVLIGSGPESDMLHAMAAEGGLGDLIDFVAWAEPEVFASYVQSCDLFVAPANFDHFPTTVISALQAGVAVLATDGVGSAVEFIEPGINGEIVRAGHPDELADAMRQLVEDPARRRRIAAAGAARMAEWPVERGARMIVDAARDAKRCAA